MHYNIALLPKKVTIALLSYFSWKALRYFWVAFSVWAEIACFGFFIWVYMIVFVHFHTICVCPLMVMFRGGMDQNVFYKKIIAQMNSHFMNSYEIATLQNGSVFSWETIAYITILLILYEWIQWKPCKNTIKKSMSSYTTDKGQWKPFACEMLLKVTAI